jgi:RNA polymerase sigma-70 factor, ECF subfamily
MSDPGPNRVSTRDSLGNGGSVTDRAEFARLTSPFQRELLVHCYRMLGSVHDAEDLVQETYLRAWQAYDNFEGRSSLRTWLYRIATNASLNALEHKGRRVLPSGLGAPSDNPELAPVKELSVPWLEPLPDDDPAAVVTQRDSVRLAMIAALQHLPARQRAVLILRDVLAWQASEVADLLDTSTAAVNSALQRARGLLDKIAPTEDDAPAPVDAEHQALLEQYLEAFQKADIDALVQVLKDDVVLEMPPHLTWFSGRPDVLRFLGRRVLTEPDLFRLVPVSANGEPAFATYRRGEDGAYHAFEIQVLSLAATGIARITVFFLPELFDRFGLPESMPG